MATKNDLVPIYDPNTNQGGVDMEKREVKKRGSVLLIMGILLIFTLLAFPFSLGPVPARSEQTKIDILSSKLGGPSYVLSFALADIINKTHPSLRATGIETNGATWNLRLMIEESKRRKSSIFFSTNFAGIASIFITPAIDAALVI